ncbi:MAG: UDP-N-acetylmuramoyl-L-alanine--D-glutamate ligase [Caldilineaceae bacterium]
MATVNAWDFSRKKVVILGLARQGLALARFFCKAGAQVVVSDMAPAAKLTKALCELDDLPVELALGGHPLSLLEGCNLLCLSGGVPPQIEIVQTAQARRIPLSNDSLLTLQLARALGLGPLLALTGSSGKTTTTTLVGKMLAASGKEVYVGGNIGTPLLDRLETIPQGACIVLELSSFQLELFNPAVAWGSLAGVGPDVAAILNITPNHLDRHPDMAAYASAKFNLLRHLPPTAQVVLSADDAVTQRLASDVATWPLAPLPASWHMETLLDEVRAGLDAQAQAPTFFSRQHQLQNGAWLADEMLIYEGATICNQDKILLRGDHNRSNLLAAAAISGAAGATVMAMRQVATTFTGVPHRLEVVSEQNGVVWINDSIATAPERAVAALRCFTPKAQTLILLAGGKDKNLPWELFADEVLARVNHLIGFGHAGSMIIEKVQERAHYTQTKAPNCAVVQRLDDAVALAARVAATPAAGQSDGVQASSLPTIILLSPGGTSYDAYRDFEERGEHFRQLALSWLKGHKAYEGVARVSQKA